MTVHENLPFQEFVGVDYLRHSHVVTLPGLKHRIKCLVQGHNTVTNLPYSDF